MPIIKSAIKRMKQTAKRRDRNVGIKHDIKSAVKSFLAKPTSEALSAAHSELDTAAKKKLLKKNTVARRKSQLSKVAKESGVKLTSTKQKAKPATTTSKDKSTAPKATVSKITKKVATTTRKSKPTAKKTEK